MARIETWFEQDLKKAVPVRKLEGVFNEDSQANVIGVQLYDDGVALTSISGSVTGYFLLADGTTTSISGTKSGGKASVVIPPAAYKVTGPITITVRITDGSNITTVCACVGLVMLTKTPVATPAGSTVADWSAQISAQLAACQAAADAVGATVAVPFNEAVANDAGTYVTSSGHMYYLPNGHTANVSLANTTKVETNCGNELTSLKSALSDTTGNDYIPLVKNKYINLSGSSITMDGGVPAYTGTSTYDCGMMQCSANDIFNISGVGGATSARLYGFVDSNGTILSPIAFANETETNKIVVAPANSAWIIVHTNDGRLSYKGKLIKNTVSDNEIESTQINAGILQASYNSNLTLQDYGINDNGTTFASTKNCCTGFRQLVIGQPYALILSSSAYAIRTVYLYSSNDSSAGVRLVKRTGDNSDHIHSVVFVAKESENYVRVSFSKIDPSASLSSADKSAISQRFVIRSLTDKNLESSGTPADAKETGDQIKAVDNKIENYTQFSVLNAPISIVAGGIGTNGATNTNTARCRITKYPLVKNDIYRVYLKNTNYKIINASSYATGESTTNVRLIKSVDETDKNNYFQFAAESGELFVGITFARTDEGTVSASDRENVKNSFYIESNNKYPSIKAFCPVEMQTTSDNVVIAPTMCAIKFKYESNKHPVPVGWLFRDNDEPFAFYWSSDGVNLTKIFEWKKSLTDGGNRSPHQYSCAITYEGDIVFVYRGDLAAQEGRTLRADPIVYPHGDYTNPVRVQFGNDPAPISWLQNDGCYCEDSRMFAAEYTRFQHDYAYVWRVGKPYINKSNWEIVKSFKVSGESRGFKHCHNIERDPFTGVLWLTTGDIPPNSGEQLEGTPGIYYSSDNGTTWATLLEGSEKYCRQINFIWLEDYVYWCSDTSDVSKHFLIRAKRNTNGIIDISTIEDLYQWYLPVATYNICYCENPKGILCLDRYDRTTDATEPIPFLFWDIEKGQMVCIGGSDIYNGTMAGYRVEGMSHYPQANGEGYLIGFGLHPNWMKFPGNILNIHDNGGYTVKAEYNIGCLNNIVIKIVP